MLIDFGRICGSLFLKRVEFLPKIVFAARPEVRPAAAKAGDYRAHQTTGGRLAAPDMSDQPRHRMAGDYRTGSAAAPLELPPATGSSRKSRRFQASSTTPARSSRRGAGMVPSRHQPANVNLMGMEQLKVQ